MVYSWCEGEKGEEMKLNCDTFIIDGVLYEYSYDPNNVHIERSCDISKRKFDCALTAIEQAHPELKVWERSRKSLKREWATHNFLWALGIAKERTEDVDLNAPLKWYISAAYWVVGAIGWLFIK